MEKPFRTQGAIWRQHRDRMVRLALSAGGTARLRGNKVRDDGGQFRKDSSFYYEQDGGLLESWEQRRDVT